MSFTEEEYGYDGGEKIKYKLFDDEERGLIRWVAFAIAGLCYLLFSFLTYLGVPDFATIASFLIFLMVPHIYCVRKIRRKGYYITPSDIVLEGDSLEKSIRKTIYYHLLTSVTFIIIVYVYFEYKALLG